MNRNARWAFLIALCVCTIRSADADDQISPYISEFLSINDHGIEDRFGARSDWIEIHNPSDQPANLQGWHLSDDSQSPKKWTFPAINIKPRGFLLIFASGRATPPPGGQLHANFKLSGDGDILTLARPDGSIAQNVDRYPSQRPDVSAGFLNNDRSSLHSLKPTPGALNIQLLDAPRIADVKHSPPQPSDAEDILITAKIHSATRPVSKVTLLYRVMYQPEIELDMFDDGQHDDAKPADGLYAARIPADAAKPGQMVRWAIIARDAKDATSREPPAAYANAPQYLGAVISTPTVPGSIPTLHWFCETPAAGMGRQGIRASLSYLGQFYDNVRVRRRGAVTSTGYKFDFNPADHFRWESDGQRVEEINVNYSSRLDETLMRPVLAFETFGAAGGVSCAAFPLRLNFNGRFQRLACFIENPDKDYLERQGLDPNGALYKLSVDDSRLADAGVFEKRTRKWENHDDLQQFLDGLRLRGQERERFILANLDIPSFLNYLSANTIVNDNDCAVKNFMLYRDSDGDRRWRILPWDKDLTFGKHFGLPDFAARDPQTHPFWGDRNHPKMDGPNIYNRIIDAALAIPTVREMYLRRLRTLMDELLQPPETPLANRHFENQIDQWITRISLDEELASSNLRLKPGLGAIKSRYLPRRREHLYINHGQNSDYPDHAAIPAPQPEHPRLEFATIDLRPTSGNPSEQFIVLKNNELTAIDLSGFAINADAVWRLPPGAVIPARGLLHICRNSAAFLNRPSAADPPGLLLINAQRKKLPAPSSMITLSTPTGHPIATHHARSLNQP